MRDDAARSVLIVGGGGREHALAWALRRSPSVSRLFAAPGNPGIAELAEIVDLPVAAIDDLVAWAVERRVGLVVIGPELPLALGLTDRLSERGILVFGPRRASSELEWSKAYAKAFLREHDIPTAAYATFDDPDAAIAYAGSRRFPLVVKADGLAAGKGVTICQQFDEAASAIRAALVDGVFGEAGRRVVVEEFLQGEELSVMALCDGERITCLPPARDYKRLGDGDTGPNTGGMGSIAPVPEIDAALLERIVATVLRPTIAGLRDAGRPYRGVLYAGLMLTQHGPKVLEFNCRFGDPETQAVLPLLAADLADLLRSCAEGRLLGEGVRSGGGFATCITLAAAGYPERPETGAPVSG
ncbi:MAG: phosphoribosylamine--glycine ligase, partial [Chloroflexota bacterium]|nr:phosphoribosylamine--glycine ligase [Chloroflexota bacterium]